MNDDPRSSSGEDDRQLTQAEWRAQFLPAFDKFCGLIEKRFETIEAIQAKPLRDRYASSLLTAVIFYLLPILAGVATAAALWTSTTTQIAANQKEIQDLRSQLEMAQDQWRDGVEREVEGLRKEIEANERERLRFDVRLDHRCDRHEEEILRLNKDRKQ